MKKTRDRKTAAQIADPHGDAMPSEIDFSGGTRGKFYRPNAKLKLPVYPSDQEGDRNPAQTRRKRR